jgi:nucleoside-diphosphate-sugar epimerase
MIAPPARIRAINLAGTNNVIAACRKHGVRALVYVSTPNVCFGGEPLHMVNEDTPYFPLEHHVDEYSRSKALAEMAVLAADRGLAAAGGAGERRLRTAALRPAAIYGEEERRHLPRIARMMALGSFSFGIGSAASQTEWLHVSNLTDALISAGSSLLSAEHAPNVGGRAFFVSDGEPLNTWRALNPINAALGMPRPRVWVPVGVALALAWLCEIVSIALRPFCTLSPLLTRAEVYKVAITHTFSNARALEYLGYEPRFGTSVGMRRVAAVYKRSEFAAAALENRRALLAFVCALVACIWLGLHVAVDALTVVVTHMI